MQHGAASAWLAVLCWAGWEKQVSLTRALVEDGDDIHVSMGMQAGWQLALVLQAEGFCLLLVHAWVEVPRQE